MPGNLYITINTDHVNDAQHHGLDKDLLLRLLVEQSEIGAQFNPMRPQGLQVQLYDLEIPDNDLLSALKRKHNLTLTESSLDGKKDYIKVRVTQNFTVTKEMKDAAQSISLQLEQETARRLAAIEVIPIDVSHLHNPTKRNQATQTLEDELFALLIQDKSVGTQLEALQPKKRGVRESDRPPMLYTIKTDNHELVKRIKERYPNLQISEIEVGNSTIFSIKLQLSNSILIRPSKTPGEVSIERIGKKIGSGSFGDVMAAMKVATDRKTPSTKVTKELHPILLGQLSSEPSKLYRGAQDLDPRCPDYELVYDAIQAVYREYWANLQYQALLPEPRRSHLTFSMDATQPLLRPRLVLPREPGITLQEFRFPESGERPSASQILTACSLLLKELARLHAAGLTHVDISPSNVLIDLEADPPVCRLIDLGCTRREKELVGLEGTKYFIAPETEYLGERGIDNQASARMDHEAAAKVLKYMLSDDDVFKRATSAQNANREHKSFGFMLDKLLDMDGLNLPLEVSNQVKQALVNLAGFRDDEAGLDYEPTTLAEVQASLTAANAVLNLNNKFYHAQLVAQLQALPAKLTAVSESWPQTDEFEEAPIIGCVRVLQEELATLLSTPENINQTQLSKLMDSLDDLQKEVATELGLIQKSEEVAQQSLHIESLRDLQTALTPVLKTNQQQLELFQALNDLITMACSKDSPIHKASPVLLKLNMLRNKICGDDKENKAKFDEVFDVIFQSLLNEQLWTLETKLGSASTSSSSENDSLDVVMTNKIQAAKEQHTYNPRVTKSMIQNARDNVDHPVEAIMAFHRRAWLNAVKERVFSDEWDSETTPHKIIALRAKLGLFKGTASDDLIKDLFDDVKQSLSNSASNSLVSRDSQETAKSKQFIFELHETCKALDNLEENLYRAEKAKKQANDSDSPKKATPTPLRGDRDYYSMPLPGSPYRSPTRPIPIQGASHGANRKADWGSDSPSYYGGGKKMPTKSEKQPRGSEPPPPSEPVEPASAPSQSFVATYFPWLGGKK